MRFDCYLAAHKSGGRLEQRSAGRFRLVRLLSSHGPVMDLSATGVRIRSKRRLSGELTLTLRRFDGVLMPVRARVIWSRRRGWRDHHVGLVLLGVSDAMARHLMQTVMAHAPVVQS